MDRVAADTAIAFLIKEISTRVDQAAAIGKAARACADAGKIAKAVDVASTSSSSAMTRRGRSTRRV